MELRVSELRNEMKQLLQSNDQLIQNIQSKETELESYKFQKEELLEINQQLKIQIQEMERKYKELEKEHIQEIALLKSNLNNSLFSNDEDEESKQQKPFENISFAAAAGYQKSEGKVFRQQQSLKQDESFLNKYNDKIFSASLIQVQIQASLLREENNLYRKLNEKQYSGEVIEEIQRGYHKLEELLNQSLETKLKQLEEENQELKSKYFNIDQMKELKAKIDSLDLVNEEDDQGLVSKIFRIIQWAQGMELDLEEWKRNYWILEKKVNQLELKEEQQQIIYQFMIRQLFDRSERKNQFEIEFDFNKKKMIKTEQDLRTDAIVKENEELKQKIQQLEEKLEIIRTSETKNKQATLLQKLITQQQVKRTGDVSCIDKFIVRNQYYNKQPVPAHFVSSNARNLQCQQRKLANLTSLSPLSIKQFYSITPILIKQSSQSPIQYKQVTRILQ